MRRRTIIQVGGAILSALNVATPLILNAQQLFPAWPWQLHALAGFVVFAGIMIWMASDYYNQVRRIVNARPNMVILGVKSIRTPIRNLQTGEILGAPCFTQVLFANDPLTPLQAVDATNVAGHIDIYAQGGQHLFYMIGRWSETKEEARGAQPFEMEQILIAPNGRANPMDITLKYREDEEGYGHNNESRRISPTDWRDDSKPLSAGNYSVRIHLRGNNVDKEFWLNMVNKGKGEDIKLGVAINVPSIPDKEGSQKSDN